MIVPALARRTLRTPFRLFAALFLIACSSACVTVGPGDIGVVWTASSGTQSHTYGEGIHSLAPWNRMDIYDLRSQSHDELLNVISENGLSIQLDASVRYHIVPNEVVPLQETIGPDYYDKIVEPVLRSEARRVIGQYTPEELYSSKRDLIEREIRGGVQAKIANQHIDLEAILIRNVELPQAIRDAIDRKLAKEQEVQEKQYDLQIASAVADQQRVEAQGIADYDKIIAQGLSPAILEFERIQEITKLATSPNAKTVVVGPGANTGPVLLQAPAAGGAAPQQ